MIRIFKESFPKEFNTLMNIKPVMRTLIGLGVDFHSNFYFTKKITSVKDDIFKDPDLIFVFISKVGGGYIRGQIYTNGSFALSDTHPDPNLEDVIKNALTVKIYRVDSKEKQRQDNIHRQRQYSQTPREWLRYNKNDPAFKRYGYHYRRADKSGYEIDTDKYRLMFADMQMKTNSRDLIFNEAKNIVDEAKFLIINNRIDHSALRLIQENVYILSSLLYKTDRVYSDFMQELLKAIEFKNLVSKFSYDIDIYSKKLRILIDKYFLEGET